MHIQKELEAATKDLWAKFVTRTEYLGKWKQYINDRNKLLNTYFQQFGFAGIGDEWQKISKRNAHQCISTIVATSLFSGGEIMSPDRASSLAKRFLSQFSESAKCFTNLQPETWEPELNLKNGYDSAWDIDSYEDEEGRGYITCIAVIVYDKNTIGILCKLESD